MVERRELENCFLINAPAGSGKTTKIENLIQSILGDNNEMDILCITYTNRAADELRGRVESKNVYISTIHSFINNFISSYFAHEEIINVYFELFGEEIKSRISNQENNNHINKTNNRYIEKHGGLTYELVIQNINKLSYNEMQHSSYYYGALSHDDLLAFTFEVLSVHPKLKRKISQKYDYIFIDEYQDTSADVLKMFYESVINENAMLYLFGDKMQQIYKNYDGSFETELMLFDKSVKLQTNYRSSKRIVDILNSIYNDSGYYQDSYDRNTEGQLPIIYFEEDVECFYRKYSEEYPNTLKLVIFNKIKFESIGAGRLYSAYDNMERYSYGRKNSAVDILTMDIEENPDDVFKELLFWQENYELFVDEKYGLVIQNLKMKLEQENAFHVEWHSDKIEIANKLESLFTEYENADDKSISYWFKVVDDYNFLNRGLKELYINDQEYERVVDVQLKEMKFLYSQLSSPNVSTQHGVKGEGHNEVLFVAEDAKRGLSVYMYDFLYLWALEEIVFTELQEFYYELKKELELIEESIGYKLQKANASLYKEDKSFIYSRLKRVKDTFGENRYFKQIYLNDFMGYIEKDNVSAMINCTKINKVAGILQAYKLFYVGCSRAKKKLGVVIDKSKIGGFEQELKEKFQEAGFVVK